MAPKKHKRTGVTYSRPFVMQETNEIMQTILAQDKAKAERPHKHTLVDLYHEAALALQEKRKRDRV